MMTMLGIMMMRMKTMKKNQRRQSKTYPSIQDLMYQVQIVTMISGVDDKIKDEHVDGDDDDNDEHNVGDNDEQEVGDSEYDDETVMTMMHDKTRPGAPCFVLNANITIFLSWSVISPW